VLVDVVDAAPFEPPRAVVGDALDPWVVAGPAPGTDVPGEALTGPVDGADGADAGPRFGVARITGAGVVTAVAPSFGVLSAGPANTLPTPGNPTFGTHGARARLAPSSTRYRHNAAASAPPIHAARRRRRPVSSTNTGAREFSGTTC
jgi:hypothetical protein